VGDEKSGQRRPQGATLQFFNGLLAQRRTTKKPRGREKEEDFHDDPTNLRGDPLDTGGFCVPCPSPPKAGAGMFSRIMAALRLAMAPAQETGSNH